MEDTSKTWLRIVTTLISILLLFSIEFDFKGIFFFFATSLILSAMIHVTGIEYEKAFHYAILTMFIFIIIGTSGTSDDECEYLLDPDSCYEGKLPWWKR